MSFVRIKTSFVVTKLCLSFVATKIIFVAAPTNDSFKGKPLFQATKQHINNTLKKEKNNKRGGGGCFLDFVSVREFSSLA